MAGNNGDGFRKEPKPTKAELQKQVMNLKADNARLADHVHLSEHLG